MFTKIAIPLDGSRLAEKALPFAVKFARHLDAQMVLLRVVEKAVGKDIVGKELDSLFAAEAYVKDVHASITDPTAALFLPAEQVQCLVLVGNPAEVIAQSLPLEDVDAIIMATHGRSGLMQLVMGSVAARLSHDCAVPVILIRPDNPKNTRLLAEEMADPAHGTTHKDGMILVPLDGTPQAEAILAPAVALAQWLELSITLLHVITPADYSALSQGGLPDSQHGSGKAEQAVAAYLSQTQAEIRAQGVPCVFAMPKSETVAGTIAAYASTSRIVLVALATYPRGRIGRFVLGSVADAVLHSSHYPVLQLWSEESHKIAAADAETVPA